MRAYTDDELRMFAAWSDYRKEYGIGGISGSTWAQEDFISGWNAARTGDHAVDNFYKKSSDWRAGFSAYHDGLDIGGVMR